MPKKRSQKQQLADAHREVQRLKEELAGQQNHLGARNFAEGRVARLETELTTARHRIQELERAETDRTKQRPMSDAELLALAATVLTEHSETTDAQRRMVAELQRRGVVAPPTSPWEGVLKRVARLYMPASVMAMAGEIPPCEHNAKPPAATP